jgi:hypothetical protein
MTPCPEHGPGCNSKACAKLLEAQYQWDFLAKRWVDPQESKDTCAECCTESLYAHPMRDEVCSHVCHTASGLPVPRPPTPPKWWTPTDRSAAKRPAYGGPPPPYYKGRCAKVGGEDKFFWENQREMGGWYANPQRCYQNCCEQGLAQAKQAVNPSEAEALVKRSCLKGSRLERGDQPGSPSETLIPVSCISRVLRDCGKISRKMA